MADITRDIIFNALKGISVPGSARDVVEEGLIRGLVIRGGHVGFVIEVDAATAAKLEPLRRACEAAIKALSGVQSVTAVLTAENPAPAAPPKAAPPPQAPQVPGIPGVKSIIAVASGKGGVGKSTTAVNLALALKALGLKAGLLDADIYGPSIPKMMGISGRPNQRADKKILPMTNYDMPCMSIGFLVAEGTAMVWRGPMVMGALQQLMHDVAWNEAGDLDVLVIDLPPGTGDAQLTIAQRVPLAGAVIVSTPQDMALIDAAKAIDMFNKVNVPILGIIENMSYFLCPHCGERSDIFGHGGARETAARIGAPFLGEVALHMEIRETSDAGKPVVACQPESAHAKAYLAIARELLNQMENAGARPKSPKIIFD